MRLWEGGFCCGIANCHHQRCDPTGLVITSFRYTCDPIRLVITDAIAAAQPDAGVWSESAGCETLRVPYFPVPTVGTLCAMDPNAGAIVPVPVPATLVQIYHPTIRIGPARHNYVYGLRFNSGVYLCDRGSEWARYGNRLFLFRNTLGPGP